MSRTKSSWFLKVDIEGALGQVRHWGYDPGSGNFFFFLRPRPWRHKRAGKGSRSRSRARRRWREGGFRYFKLQKRWTWRKYGEYWRKYGFEEGLKQFFVGYLERVSVKRCNGKGGPVHHVEQMAKHIVVNFCHFLFQFSSRTCSRSCFV